MRLNLALLLLFAFITPTIAQEKPAETQDIRTKALESFWETFTKAYTENDKAAWMSLYLPNAAILLPHEPPVIGKESRFPAPKRRKAAALDGIIICARSLWYRSLRSTYPPGTDGSPSAP